MSTLRSQITPHSPGQNSGHLSNFNGDSKDLIISQLKREIYDLRVNERDFSELNSQLSNLEHRYSLLHDEKVKCEQEYKARTDVHLKQIANLKTDVDTLKTALNERNNEINILENDYQAFQELAQIKEDELEKCKNEMYETIQNGTQIAEERSALEKQNSQLRIEKEHLLDEIEQLNSEIQKFFLRNKDLEKLISELEYEKINRDKQIKLIKEEIELTNQEMKEIRELNQAAEEDITSFQRTIIDCENEMNILHRECDKLKSENTSLIRQLKSDNERLQEAESNINKLEAACRSKEQQIDYVKEECEKTKLELSHATSMNYNLIQEGDNLRNMLERLTMQHQEALDEIDKITKIDEQVRHMLDRKASLNDLKSKGEKEIRMGLSGLQGSEFVSGSKVMSNSRISKKF